ncbi:MAG TPA: transglycosylase family protein [Mycobacteriales bacterium]|nr:transglycosylase family protein [Mycobacteriales bacterium]
MTATLGALATPSQAQAASSDDFARLRQCESGGNYRINTGNGYYGAYQFRPSTWRSLGYGGLPHRASPAIQDQAARRLQARHGWGQWPACSRRLGLRR